MTIEEAEALRLERLAICRKTIDMEKTDRILNKSFFVTWKYWDAGYKLSEAMEDLHKIEEANIRHQAVYGFDLFTDNGTRNAFRVTKEVGHAGYIFDDEAYAISVPETEYVTREQLPDFVKDPKKFIWEQLMPIRFPEFFEDHDVNRFARGYKELMDFFGMSARVNKRLAEEYGVPVQTGLGTPFNAPEWIINRLRGIRGFSLDMRQAPELLDDVVAAFKELVYDPGYNNIKNAPDGHNPNVCFDAGAAMLAHNILNLKQFDKYYWPFLGKTLDLIEEKGMSDNLFVQGEGKRFFHHFQDYKKGTLVLSLENDDLAETRKFLPNACLSGGMRLDVLGYATPEECVELAKRCIDAVDGIGYIFSEDKMATYPNDCRAENLKAVCDFVNNFRM